MKAVHLTLLFKDKIELRILAKTIDFNESIEGLAIDKALILLTFP